ncbi:MAG TPA: response regulator, partial [Steroidobacteraceae bacterium]|nr:response regulator [Steroidobacteraceae bacterium]
MSDLAPIEILYVEDNPQDAELTMRALRKAAVGNRIEWVRDGAEALEFLFQQGRFANRANGLPRLMLLDLKMPKVSGLEVLERIKADERFR